MARGSISSLLRRLPNRGKISNKSHGGRLWVVAGSKRFPGAAILTSTAAARTGSGYVALSMLSEAAKVAPIWMTSPDFIVLTASVRSLNEFRPNAVAIGPGIGRTRASQNVVRRILNGLKSRPDVGVVVDADGLLALGRTKLPSHWILTPHSGELAKLLGKSVKKVDADREVAVCEAQSKYGCIVVLKGHGTLIASPSKRFLDRPRVFRNTSGNSALAKAGTGDVLTGIISGLLAQRVEPLVAARLGVWLHGYLADRWTGRGRDHLSLMASDLIADIPYALAEARKKLASDTSGYIELSEPK